MHAMKIAPGMRRHFAAERWGIVPEERWTEIRKEAHARDVPGFQVPGVMAVTWMPRRRLSHWRMPKRPEWTAGCGFTRPI